MKICRPFVLAAVLLSALTGCQSPAPGPEPLRPTTSNGAVINTEVGLRGYRLSLPDGFSRREAPEGEPSRAARLAEQMTSGALYLETVDLVALTTPSDLDLAFSVIEARIPQIFVHLPPSRRVALQNSILFFETLEDAPPDLDVTREVARLGPYTVSYYITRQGNQVHICALTLGKEREIYFVNAIGPLPQEPGLWQAVQDVFTHLDIL